MAVETAQSCEKDGKENSGQVYIKMPEFLSWSCFAGD